MFQFLVIPAITLALVGLYIGILDYAVSHFFHPMDQTGLVTHHNHYIRRRTRTERLVSARDAA